MKSRLLGSGAQERVLGLRCCEGAAEMVPEAEAHALHVRGPGKTFNFLSTPQEQSLSMEVGITP